MEVQRKLLLIDEEVTKLQLELCMLGHDDYLGASAKEENIGTFKHKIMDPILQQYNLDTKAMVPAEFKEISDLLKSKSSAKPDMCWKINATDGTDAVYVIFNAPNAGILGVYRSDAKAVIVSKNSLGERTYDKLKWNTLWSNLTTDDRILEERRKDILQVLKHTQVPPFNVEPPTQGQPKTQTSYRR